MEEPLEGIREELLTVRKIIYWFVVIFVLMWIVSLGLEAMYYRLGQKQFEQQQAEQRDQFEKTHAMFAK